MIIKSCLLKKNNLQDGESWWEVPFSDSRFINRENDKINEEGEEVHLEKSMRLDIKNKFMLW